VWLLLVYLDGPLVCACLVAAGQAEGARIETVEGPADGDTLHPVQQAYVATGASSADSVRRG